MKAENFNWFIQNYQDLFKKYGEKYLVIRDKSVVDAFDQPKQALEEASRLFSDGDFIIQLCNGDETGYTNFVANSLLAVI